jgi:cytochrome c peroxidase
MQIPPDSPLTAAAAELGRHLFYDTGLSFNDTIACGSCHRQELAFTDGRRLSPGATQELTTRNSMSLTNVGFNGVFTWADDSLTTLEQQALVPLMGEHPLEMGLAGNEETVLARLATDEKYRGLFAAAYGEGSITVGNVVRALASFQRGIVSFDAPFDRYQTGVRDALSPLALRGRDLFFSEQLKCFRCHGGANFRFTPGHRRGESDRSVAYHNTGLYNVDGKGAYPERDQGLFEVTGDPADRGRFKAPTLRNIVLTGPYMHDGSIATLEEVLAHYARGGRLISAGADAGDGRLSPLKSELVKGFELGEADTEAVLAFLHSLTDEALMTNEALSDPSR